MLKKFVSLFLLFFTLSCATTNVYNSPKIERSNRHLRSFGMIFVNGKKTHEMATAGTVFAINENELVTAGHVCVGILSGQVFGAYEFNIRMQYLDAKYQIKELSNLEIAELDLKNDLCLVKREGHSLVPLKLANEVSLGERAIALGSPLGVFPMETEGKVMALDATYLDPSLNGKILLSLPVFAGNSGGPVLNQSGEVIGVITLGVPIYPQISFAVHIDRLKAFLKVTHGK